jgi:uncharacterized protein YgiM (DUF1202 family)
MKALHLLASVCAVTVATVGTALPSLARPATLIAQSGSQINVRSAPTISASRAHYGLAGDRVEVMRSVIGSDRAAWDYVKFASGAKGWVRGDLVRYRDGKAEYGVLGGKAGDRINVRATPSTSATSPHYGMQGDVVQLLKNTNTNGSTWHFVQFPSGAKGWVRGDLVKRMNTNEGCSS